VHFDRVDREQLLSTFREAFADYAVDVSSITEEMKRVRCVKNAVDWDVSVGVFDAQRMVAFTLIGVDDWQGERCAFDAATGVVPDFRGQGLAGRMIEHALPALRERDVTRFVLEVLQQNEPAIRAYRNVGFEVTRELSCFELDPSRLPQSRPGATDIRPLDRDGVVSFGDHLDWQPSWENGIAAVGRIPDELVVLGAYRGGECLGTIAYTPALNSVLLLVVNREARRQGIATSLLRGLAERLPAGTAVVRLLNVDGSDDGMLSFVRDVGCRHSVDQFEMARTIWMVA